jgi:hypothetical protein
MEVDFSTSEETYRREGFELAAELILDRLDECKDIPEARSLVNRILALLRERKLVQVSQEIGLP